MKIVIDKGHIGLKSDPGAVGNGLYESDLTNKLGDLTKSKLDKYIVDIKFAPRETLTDRTNYANSINADYFLSLHINASNNNTATGWESFVHNNASQNSIKYQKVIHTEIMSYLKQFNIIDRGMKKANFAVLRNSKMEACLIENLFISNANDAKFLKDDKFLDGLADSISKGIIKAFNLQLKEIEENNKEEKENKQDDNQNNSQTNNIKFKYNNQLVNVDYVNVDSKVYVYIRDVCNLFDKNINWDGNSRIISIDDK